LAGPDEASASMAVEAARDALTSARLDPSAVDLCIVATCTPDQPMPSTAAFVAEALGLRGGAFDLAAACSGFVYGLVTASALVMAGGIRAALVIGSDTLGRCIDFSDRSTGMLFGDGAGAVVVTPLAATERGGGEPPGLLAWDLGCDGTAAHILEIQAGGSRLPASEKTLAAGQQYVRMDGREVYRRAVRAVVDSVTLTMQRAGVGPSDVDWFVPHQANARIVDSVLPRVGLSPERTLTNIDRYGNTSAASIPIALAEANEAGRLKAGDLVLMTGFGAGMTWASALVRWGTAPVAPPP
jgi:3-oxoacyl-[acyl-carrier-protein] synthase-3